MLTLALAAVAVLLAIITLIQSRGSALLSWAVLCLGAIYFVGRF